MTVYGLFGSETEAKDAKDRFSEQNFIDRAGEKLSGVAIVKSPVVQTWTASPLYVVQPSGLSIENDSIHFDWSAGAWVLDFVYTRGSSTATNVLFIPRAEGKDVNGALTYDSDTQVALALSCSASIVVLTCRVELRDLQNLSSVSCSQATFSPNNFPCQFNPSGGSNPPCVPLHPPCDPRTLTLDLCAQAPRALPQCAACSTRKRSTG